MEGLILTVNRTDGSAPSSPVELDVGDNVGLYNSGGKGMENKSNYMSQASLVALPDDMLFNWGDFEDLEQQQEVEEQHALEEEDQEEEDQEEEDVKCEVLLSKTKLRVVEGGACDFYTIRLSARPKSDVMVQIEDTGNQLRTSPKVVRFSWEAKNPDEPGHWSTPQIVRVMAIDDDAVEGISEMAKLNHISLSGDNRFSTVAGRCRIVPRDLLVDICDNDGGYIYTFGEIHASREMLPLARSLRGAGDEAAAHIGLNNNNHKNSSGKERRKSSDDHSGGEEDENEETRALVSNGKNQTTGEGVRTISCGDNHMTIALADGRLFTIGLNGNGQLGLGDFKNRTHFSVWRSIDRDGVLRSKICQVACGAAHTAMVTDDGRLLMAGSNEYGQLGVCDGPNAGCLECLTYRQEFENTESLSEMIKANKAAQEKRFHRQTKQNMNHRGGQNTALETATVCAVPRLVECLSHLFVERVACGSHHTVVLASTGSSNTDRGVVKCRVFGWGDSSSGALGMGLQGKFRHPLELLELKDLDPFEIACGNNFTAALCGAGDLYTSGWGLNGCYGRRAREDDPTLNNFHMIKVPHRKEQPLFVEVACGHSHLAAITDDGSLYVCGNNECGQLGVGDKIFRSHLTQVCFFEGLQVCNVSLGMFHSTCTTLNGDLYVWGSNDAGQLGLGTHVLQQAFPILQSVISEGVKQVQAGKAFTSVILGRPSNNFDPDKKKERIRQYEQRLASFLNRKKQEDREKQEKFLAKQKEKHKTVAEQLRDRGEKKYYKKNRHVDKDKILEMARYFPYETITKFSPRIIKKPVKARVKHKNMVNRHRKLVEHRPQELTIQTNPSSPTKRKVKTKTKSSRKNKESNKESPASPISPTSPAYFSMEMSSLERASRKYGPPSPHKPKPYVPTVDVTAEQLIELVGDNETPTKKSKKAKKKRVKTKKKGQPKRAQSPLDAKLFPEDEVVHNAL